MYARFFESFILFYHYVVVALGGIVQLHLLPKIRTFIKCSQNQNLRLFFSLLRLPFPAAGGNPRHQQYQYQQHPYKSYFLHIFRSLRFPMDISCSYVSAPASPEKQMPSAMAPRKQEHTPALTFLQEYSKKPSPSPPSGLKCMPCRLPECHSLRFFPLTPASPSPIP